VALPLVEAMLDEDGVVMVTEGDDVVAPSVVVVFTGEVDGLLELARPVKELPDPWPPPCRCLGL
jgi:hypothetical protein